MENSRERWVKKVRSFALKKNHDSADFPTCHKHILPKVSDKVS